MCMSVGFFFALMIWLVVVGALYAIIKLVIPAVLANSKGGGHASGRRLSNIVSYVAALMIIVLYPLIWDLVECLVGGGCSELIARVCPTVGGFASICHDDTMREQPKEGVRPA